MTNQVHTTSHETFATTLRRAGASIGSGIWVVCEAIANRSTGARCAEEARRLDRLSDAELAKLGLTRDRIFQHAFRRYLPV